MWGPYPHTEKGPLPHDFCVTPSFLLAPPRVAAGTQPPRPSLQEAAGEGAGAGEGASDTWGPIVTGDSQTPSSCHLQSGQHVQQGPPGWAGCCHRRDTQTCPHRELMAHLPPASHSSLPRPPGYLTARPGSDQQNSGWPSPPSTGWHTTGPEPAQLSGSATDQASEVSSPQWSPLSTQACRGAAGQQGGLGREGCPQVGFSEGKGGQLSPSLAALHLITARTQDPPL